MFPKDKGSFFADIISVVANMQSLVVRDCLHTIKLICPGLSLLFAKGD